MSEETSWISTVLVAAALVGAVYVIWRRVIWPLTELRDDFRTFLGDWKGRPDRPGVKGTDGVMKRLLSYEETQAWQTGAIKEIQVEMRTNGGDSIKDAVMQTREHLFDIEGKIEGKDS